eukprot:366352_1
MAMLRQLCSTESSVLTCALVAVALRGGEKSGCDSSNLEKNKETSNVHAVTEWLREAGTREKTAVVIGSGVIGLCIAEKLVTRGYNRVAVLDGSISPAVGCNSVDGGQMSRNHEVVSFSSFMHSLYRTLPGLHWLQDVAKDLEFFHLKWRNTFSDPHFLRWLMLFSYNHLAPESITELKADHIEMLGFTDWAVKELYQFIKENDWHDRCALTSGILSLIYGGGGTISPYAVNTLEVQHKVSGFGALSDLEPSLLYREGKQSVVGIHEPASLSANSIAFRSALHKMLESKKQVEFLKNTKVLGISQKKQQTTFGLKSIATVCSLQTSGGELLLPSETEVIIAADAWTPQLLWMVGIWAPVYPIKGYSITMPVPAEVPPSALPHQTVSDKALTITKQGDEVTVRGLGEFAAWETAPDVQMDRLFREQVCLHLPAFKPFIESTTTQCYLRPLTADSCVVIGRIPGKQNLSMVCGPGIGGYKISLGAAKLLVSSLEENKKDSQSSSDDLGFNPSVFAPENRGVREATAFSWACRQRWKDSSGGI